MDNAGVILRMVNGSRIIVYSKKSWPHKKRELKWELGVLQKDLKNYLKSQI